MYRKFAIFLLTLLSCFNLPLAQDVSDDTNNDGKANAFVDNFIEELKIQASIRKYLETININKTIIQKNFEVKNINVTGLLNIERYGEASLSTDNEEFHVTTEIAVIGLRVQMNVTCKLPDGNKYEGDGKGTIAFLAAKINISRTKDAYKVNSFKVSNLGPHGVSQINGCKDLNEKIKNEMNVKIGQKRNSLLKVIDEEGLERFNEILHDKDDGEANKYVDEFIETLKKQANIRKYLETIKLDQNYTGSDIEVYNINVKGMLNIARFGGSSLTTEDEMLHLVTEIAVTGLRVEMDVICKPSDGNQTEGKGKGTIDFLSGKLNITRTKDGKYKVNSFTVTSLGPHGITEISGCKDLDKEIKDKMNVKLGQNRKFLIGVIEKEGLERFNESLISKDESKANIFVNDLLKKLKEDHRIRKYLEKIKLGKSIIEDDVEATKINVTGLLNIARFGESSMSKENGILHVTTEIAVTGLKVDMNVTCKPKVEDQLMRYEGKGKGNIEFLSAKVDISSTRDGFKVNSFNVTKLGAHGITEITGCEEFDDEYILKINDKLSESQETLKSVIAKEGKKRFNEILREFQIPHPEIDSEKQ